MGEGVSLRVDAVSAVGKGGQPEPGSSQRRSVLQQPTVLQQSTREAPWPLWGQREGGQPDSGSLQQQGGQGAVGVGEQLPTLALREEGQPGSDRLPQQTGERESDSAADPPAEDRMDIQHSPPEASAVRKGVQPEPGSLLGRSDLQQPTKPLSALGEGGQTVVDLLDSPTQTPCKRKVGAEDPQLEIPRKRRNVTVTDVVLIEDDPPERTELASPLQPDRSALTWQEVELRVQRLKMKMKRRPPSASQRVASDFLSRCVCSDRDVVDRVCNSKAVLVPPEIEISDVISESDQFECTLNWVTRHDPIVIERKDFDGLKDTSWVTGNVVSAYMCLLEIRHHIRHEEDPTKLAGSAFLNTSAWEHMKDLTNAANRLHRIFKKSSVLTADRLFIPINIELQNTSILSSKKGVHWALAVVVRSERTIKFYDSFKQHMKGCKPTPEYCMQRLGEALNDMLLYNDGNATPIVWKYVTVRPTDGGIPLQRDGFNCGLFVCANADDLASGREPSGFSSEMMSTMRMSLRQILWRCTTMAQAC